ncbi:MAG: 3'-5' exonuclease [Bacteroidetes bacterium]|nr:3'-5' exonuclease [Bacteroidota bacterium]
MNSLPVIQNILFIDIETVPQHPEYSRVPERMKKLWDKKCENFKEDKMPYEFYERAGIYSEFGKIVCICCGYFNDQQIFVEEEFYGHDEKAILLSFKNLISNKFYLNNKVLCAHNGKEFDFPYISRRMLIHNIQLPSMLEIAGKKPWEVKHLDTMELWKFGDYKSYTSLDLLAAVFNITTPKDDIDGSKVGETYWKNDDLQRIVVYCKKDVRTLCEIYMRIAQVERVSFPLVNRELLI